MFDIDDTNIRSASNCTLSALGTCEAIITNRSSDGNDKRSTNSTQNAFDIDGTNQDSSIGTIDVIITNN